MYKRQVFVILAKYGFPVIIKMVEGRKTYIDQSLEVAREANAQLSKLKQEGDEMCIRDRLYRPAQARITTDKDSGYPTEGLGVVIVAKQRNGETGNAYFCLLYTSRCV